MNPSQHLDEQRYLDETLSFIDDEISYMTQDSPPWAAYTAAAKKLKEHREARIAQCRNARPRPYFGRVDFQEENGSLTKAYIGEYNIGDRVYSWASEYAGALYFADPNEVHSYCAPEGVIRGAITLKRSYRIEDARLLDLTDVWSILAPGQPGSSAFLLNQLSQARTGQLRETIATIQWDQYQQIAANADEVILLQGAAGSGKTIVGTAKARSKPNLPVAFALRWSVLSIVSGRGWTSHGNTGDYCATQQRLHAHRMVAGVLGNQLSSKYLFQNV